MNYFFYARTSITCPKRLEISGIIDANCSAAAFEEAIQITTEEFEVTRNEVCIVTFNEMTE